MPPAASDNTLAGSTPVDTPLYIDPHLQAIVAAQEDHRFDLLAKTPQAKWFTDWSTSDTARSDVGEYLAGAAAAHAVPVLVLYRIPARDCGSWSSGGAESEQEYKDWITAVAAALKGHREAMVILEPDALPQVGRCKQGDRLGMLQFAVNKLSTTGARVYIDIGNEDWLSPEEAARRLKEVGVGKVTGFSVNVAAHYTTGSEVLYAESVRAELAKLDMPIEHALAMDARAFIDGLLAAAGAQPPERLAPWRSRCGDWKRRYAMKDGKAFPTRGPISHFHFADALSDAIPADTPVGTGSSGLAVEALYAGFRNKPGQRIFLTSGLGAMGYGLPAAIGTCYGNDGKPMVAVESDGSLQLNLQELATLVGQKLPICLVVMNNGGYCSIRNTQRNYFDSRFIGTGPEAGLLMPDLARLAQAYDLPYLKISDAADLAGGLARGLALPRPCIVDVQLIPDETLSPKSAAIPRADGSIVSMPLEDMSPLLPIEVLEAEMSIPLLPASYEARKR